ncbi:hypothetical protein [Paraburkholderia humisilvae]|uniref:hypothetical protein n=1 Tax=Paraburkholderia humisilvae TaxID=627669 RepID=UPI0015817F5C|nr:hypothetical protein [Paraburkholderia humisilvae]
MEIVREQAVAKFQANAPLKDLMSAVAGRRLVSAVVAQVLEKLNDTLRDVKHTLNPAEQRYDLGHVSPRTACAQSEGLV